MSDLHMTSPRPGVRLANYTGILGYSSSMRPGRHVGCELLSLCVCVCMCVRALLLCERRGFCDYAEAGGHIGEGQGE